MKNQIDDYLITIKFVVISVISGLLAVVFLPILTHAMSNVEFALFSKSLLYSQMIATPSVFGMSAYITTLVGKIDFATDDIGNAFADWFLMLAILSIVIIVGVLMLGLSLSVILLVLIAYMRAFQSVGSQSCRLFRSQLGFFLHQLVIPAFFFIIAIAFSKTFTLSGINTFYIASIIYLLASIYLWRDFKCRGWINLVWLGRFRNQSFVRFAFGAFTHSLAGLAVTSWDKIYTASVLSPVEFGVYIVGAQYAGGLVLIFSSITQAIVPKMYILIDQKKNNAVACVKFFISAVFGYLIIFGFFEMTIGPVMRFLFPVHFHPAVQIAQLLGIAALLQGFYFISSAVVFYYHQTFSLAMITFCCGAIGAIFAFVSDAAKITEVVDIVIVVWGAFFSITTIYSALLIMKKND